MREDDALSVFLDAHHGRRRAVGLGNDVEGAALKVVAAENALVGLKSLFVGPLVALAKIPPVAAVVTVENLVQILFHQPLRRPGGGVDLPQRKARFHEAVGHWGSRGGDGTPLRESK